MDLSRLDTVHLIACTATKATDHEPETDGRISLKCGADRHKQRVCPAAFQLVQSAMNGTPSENSRSWIMRLRADFLYHDAPNDDQQHRQLRRAIRTTNGQSCERALPASW